MITPNGGVFGRNPTFNNVTVENNLTVNGDFTLGDDIVINDTLLVNGVATFRGGIISIPNSAAPTSNTVLGNTAGAALQSGATDNVLLGATAGDSITTGDQCIVIGSGADVAAATNANSIVIGHGTVGNGSNTTTIGNSSTTAAWLAGTLYPGRADSTRFGTSGFSIRSTGSDNGVWQANIATADVSNRFSVRSNDGATDRFTVANGGDATIHNGNLVIGTSGKGIDFSADANAAGMTSELLDDYEEGTFTPTFSQGVTSPTYTEQSGTYTKIGQIVYIQIRLNLSGGTADASGLNIGGLPFTSNSTLARTSGGYVVYSQNWIASNTSAVPTIFIPALGTVMEFYKNDGNAFVGTDANSIADPLLVNAWYIV